MQEKTTLTVQAGNESNLNQRQFGGFIYQATHTFFTRGLMIPVAIVTGVLVARFLGPEGKGIIAILSAPVMLVCAFGEFGIRQATGYLIGKKEYDPKDIQASMLALFCVTGTLGFAATLIAYAFLGTFEHGLGVNLLFACTVPIILLRRFANGLLLGRQMITGMNYIEILDRVTLLLGILGLVVWLQHGVFGAGLAYFLGSLVSASMLLFLISRFASLKPRWVTPIPLELLRKGILYAASLFFISLNGRIGILMLGAIRDESQVGIYSVGISISEMIWQIPLSLGVVLFARSLSWSPRQARHRLDHVLLLLRIMFPVSALCAGGLFLVSHFLVPVLYGKEFTDSIAVLAWLLPGTVPMTLFLFMHFYAAGQGNPQLALNGFIPAVILSILLNLYLIPKFGYLGAAFSSTFSYAFGSTVYVFFFRKIYPCRILDIIALRRSDIVYLWNLRNSKQSQPKNTT